MAVPWAALQAVEQFGALYMHKLDDKHSIQPGFEPSTSEFRAITEPNEPSGLAGWPRQKQYPENTRPMLGQRRRH